jgi:uncharacterized membrane protein YGL010W
MDANATLDSPQRPLLAQLAKYASYHRDRRNIATHFIGVPMIVFAVMVLLSRPEFKLNGIMLSPMWVAALLAVLYYLRLEITLGLVMAASFIGLGLAAANFAHTTTLVWLGTGVGVFVVGWAIQFLGHYYEGKKPAFVDDIMGLLIGPLFVAAELLFLLGLRRDLEREIEAIAGPTHIRAQGAVV